MKNLEQEVENLIKEKGISSAIVDVKNYLNNKNSKEKQFYQQVLNKLLEL